MASTWMCGLCVALTLQLTVASQLRTKWNEPVEGKKSRVFKLVEQLNMAEFLNKSYPHPPGSGCAQRPAAASQVKPHKEVGDSSPYLADFNIGEWSGFCEMGFTSCPDARKNRDYLHFAKSVPTNWTKNNLGHAYEYCEKSGFFDTKYREAFFNFEKLQALGKEYCQKPVFKRWSNYMTLDRAQHGHIGEFETGDMVANGFEKAAIAGGLQSMSPMPMLTFGLGSVAAITAVSVHPRKFLNDIGFDTEMANKAAAFSCAAGDVSCDIAFCQYSFVPDLHLYAPGHELGYKGL